jgi:ribose-phosphate pyrophosphokinase
MPYIPHARMDRVKNDEDVFTLKYFCEIINSLHFTTVEVRDAHSNVSLALLNNVYEDPIEDYVRDAINQSGAEALFFPDEGAMKRYSSESKLPYAFGMKKRDWKTGQIQGLDVAGNVESIRDKNILIVDDICSKGGTFYFSAKKLKELGAKNIYLYVTHCENTIFEGELLTGGLISKIFTTNSLLSKNHDMIEIADLQEA